MKQVTEWRVAVGGLSAIGVGYGFARYGYGLFLPRLEADFSLSVTQTGLIGSLGYAGYLVALAAVGALVARVGPRPLVVAGGLAATVGLALAALARGPALLIVGLVVASTSPACMWSPYADAVRVLLPEGRRERMLALIPSGTAFAVVVAGPLALLAPVTGWRPIWLAFAALALATTVYNGLLLGRGSPMPVGERLSVSWLTQRAAVPLYVTAVSYGLLGSVYWTYAVAAVHAMPGPLFWSLMGLSGTAGVVTARLLSRLGLARGHLVLLLAQAAALALLGVAPGVPLAAVASALLYGCSYMAFGGLLAVWAGQVFPEAPATGLSAVFLVTGGGSVVGPVALAAVAAHWGLGAAFLVTSACTALTTLTRPVVKPLAGPSPHICREHPSDAACHCPPLHIRQTPR
ncbi:putative MFS family arabinose efflux permease [Amycolatopsis bartoniae]|uniref:MFS transporter n=1 Tax=Amycolatopsis bartoniae TaxID=941986 RepID=UPI001605BF34|nr:YbfB/YjiJ family MFS transporter [Amycolatopsis bartoniae]MBB2933744.1 putative MFS family arabinose efflux permease [Amycolatopsis bartoniae]